MVKTKFIDVTEQIDEREYKV